MRKLISSILVLGLTIFLGLANQAGATPVIDGIFGLAEWAGHYSEDNTTGQYFVDPGYGGQEYDVEYLGLQMDSDNLYFGLLTGHTLQDGRDWPAGDIALDINSNGSYDFAIDFNVNGNSVDFTLIDMQGAPIVAYGETNNDNLAWEDVRYSAHSASNPYQAINIPAGGHAFNGSYQAQDDPINGEQSYGLEGQLSLAALRLAFLGDIDSITGHWTMACGNDFLNHTESAPVPEPATMLLFGTGLAGFATAYRRKMSFTK